MESLLATFVAGLASLSVSCDADGITSIYDEHFRSAAQMHLPDRDWCRLKAIGQVESNLREDAESWAGAGGVMQIMPATASGYGVMPQERFNAAVNIQTGARHVSVLFNFWTAPRAPDEEWRVVLASYNAGQGNVLRAQMRCGEPMPWHEIRKCLPQITGEHSVETFNYVDRNEQVYSVLTDWKEY